MTTMDFGAAQNLIYGSKRVAKNNDELRKIKPFSTPSNAAQTDEQQANIIHQQQHAQSLLYENLLNNILLAQQLAANQQPPLAHSQQQQLNICALLNQLTTQQLQRQLSNTNDGNHALFLNHAAPPFAQPPSVECSPYNTTNLSLCPEYDDNSAAIIRWFLDDALLQSQLHEQHVGESATTRSSFPSSSSTFYSLPQTDAHTRMPFAAPPTETSSTLSSSIVEADDETDLLSSRNKLLLLAAVSQHFSAIAAPNTHMFSDSSLSDKSSNDANLPLDLSGYGRQQVEEGCPRYHHHPSSSSASSFCSPLMAEMLPVCHQPEVAQAFLNAVRCPANECSFATTNNYGWSPQAAGKNKKTTKNKGTVSRRAKNADCYHDVKTAAQNSDERGGCCSQAYAKIDPKTVGNHCARAVPAAFDRAEGDDDRSSVFSEDNTSTTTTTTTTEATNTPTATPNSGSQQQQQQRLSYPREFKLLVIEVYFANGQNKYRTCKDFQITKSMLNGWLQKADKIHGSRPGSLKSGRSGRRPQFPSIERDLFELLKFELDQGNRVSNKWIRETAKLIARDVKNNNCNGSQENPDGGGACQFSERWLNNFKKRYQLQQNPSASSFCHNAGVEQSRGLLLHDDVRSDEFLTEFMDTSCEGGETAAAPSFDTSFFDTTSSDERVQLAREICAASFASGRLPIEEFYRRFPKKKQLLGFIKNHD